MSNIKSVSIVADVAFDYMDSHEGGLPAEERALIASVLLGPSIGLEYSYKAIGYQANSNGGQTAMYRLRIEGEEALRWPFLTRIARALKDSGPLAKVHVAEAADIENGGVWEHLDKTILSGEAH